MSRHSVATGESYRVESISHSKAQDSAKAVSVLRQPSAHQLGRGSPSTATRWLFTDHSSVSTSVVPLAIDSIRPVKL